MTQLLWRSIEKTDVRDLQRFCCAEPRLAHSAGRPEARPDPWACEAEAYIRTARVRKPPRFALVGRDALGIGAVARFREDDGGSFFLIEAIGVARHWRRCRIGDEAVAQVIEAITQRALVRNVTSVLVQGNVHQDNKPSLALLERWGFREQWRDGVYLSYAVTVYV